MQINIAVIDLFSRHRHWLPRANFALRRSDETARRGLPCLRTRCAAGLLLCIRRRIAADEPDPYLPRPIGPKPGRRWTHGPALLAA